MCDGNCEGCSKGKGCDKLYALTEWQVDLFSKYHTLVPKGGKPIPLVVQNPSNSATLEHLLQGMFERKSMFIPKDANAYAASDFDGGTQHVRTINGVDKQFSVYAIQFYHLGWGL